MTKIIYNKLLGGFFICKGPHQTPISGRFNSKLEAQAHLDRAAADRDRADAARARGRQRARAALARR
jgi:hypothetical protein